MYLEPSDIIKKIGLLLLVCFTISCSKEGDSIECIDCITFNYNGIEREYLLHLPDNLPDNAPLIFVLHGYGGYATPNWPFFDLPSIADTAGFALVIPQGLRDDNDVPHWNAGFTISQVDDVGFLTELAQFLQNEYQLNPLQTFTCGISNGGFMSYHLVAERPDIFRAAGSIVGSMSGQDWNNRNSLSPVPIFQLSGVLDEVIPIDGSLTWEGGWAGAPDMETIINFWVGLNDCISTETFQPNENTTAYRHKNGIDGNEVWYYLVDNIGHEVPYGINGSVNSAELVWEFFNQY